MNAIEFLKSSTLYRSSSWLKPVISGVLDDSYTSQIIDELLIKLFNLEISSTIEKAEVDPADHDPVQNPKKHIHRIATIEKIENVGLLNLSEKMTLNPGLNVFYGKNGAGKSTIYTGLCKVLGKDSKQVIPSIYGSNNNSVVEITCICDGSEQNIIWTSKESNPDTGIMLFDNQISNVIVEQDQINEFDLAHLKSEYFVYIREVLETLEEKMLFLLGRRKEDAQQIKEFLSEKVPFILTGNFTKEKVHQHVFNDGQSKELEHLQRSLDLLNREELTESIKNIDNAVIETGKILGTFGSFHDEEYTLSYTVESLTRVNKLISDYNLAKLALDGQTAHSGIVPESWISNTTWSNFISTSIEFVNSLEANEQRKFNEETCVYCHQPLESDLSKKLISLYRELQVEHSSKLRGLEDKIKAAISRLNNVLVFLDSLNSTEPRIEAEFDKINKIGQKCIDSNDVKKSFEEIHEVLVSKGTLNVESIYETIKQFCEFYLDLHIQLKTKSVELKSSLDQKKQKILELQKQIEPLVIGRDLMLYKHKVIEFFELNEIISVIDKRKSELSRFKRSLAQQKTKFMNEEIMKQFENLLKKEYENLEFSPPDVWKLKTSTRGDVNKRVYSLNDKKLSQIFSEGERKIHSLADFFAQSELNNYQGVYIFDDPVNSLDEDKMQYVSKRIMKLVDQGNQVFVFTHNLVFLNMLVSDPGKDKINKVTRLSSQVHIEANKAIDNIGAMKERHREINKRIQSFKQRSILDITEYELRNVYDLMSGYLEDYVEQKLLSGIISRYRPNIRMNSVDSLKGIESELIDELCELYEQTSRKGSRHSQPIGAPKPLYEELLSHFELLDLKFKY
ncbi:AAA family ATPase [Paenibacillus lautus]|uniref:AAA family ATPase n=1 Tax=Paenibacillus lautus TaxID=1401 RepID=UPI002FBE5FC1